MDLSASPFKGFSFRYPQSFITSKNSYASKCTALHRLAKMLFRKGKKINSDSGRASVREDHLYNILVFENVETWHSGGVKTSWFFFLTADSAPDDWVDCESALETRNRIMSSEMWWCVVSIYLTDAQLHPHSPTRRCIVWHRSPTHFPIAL